MSGRMDWRRAKKVRGRPLGTKTEINLRSQDRAAKWLATIGQRRRRQHIRQKKRAFGQEHHLADSPRLRTLIEKFRDKAYRELLYRCAYAPVFGPTNARKFRGEKSQTDFGALIDKRQTVVSRLEDPKYRKWTLQTLFDVAEKLNVAVLVRFVDIPTFLRVSEDMSEDASQPQPYDEAKAAELLERPPKKLKIRPFRSDEPSKKPIPVFGIGDEEELIEIEEPSAGRAPPMLGGESQRLPTP